MLKLLDEFPYPILITVAVLMFLLPFIPMPHAIEKLLMLKNGTLTEPIDIFDLLFHKAPSLPLLLKVLRDLFK